MSATLLASGSIWIHDGFLAEADALYVSLATGIAWDNRMKARQSASFGRAYNYSGIVWPEIPFPEMLLPVLANVAARLGYRPNNCLANFYADGNATMGFHFDATEELEPGTGIAVLSLGAERTLTFRQQLDRRREAYPLCRGSLLFMSAAMQSEWKHAVLPEPTAAGGRISLTFRCLRPFEPGQEPYS
jgi:alkylated DNA repair dioxygenase AlkB